MIVPKETRETYKMNILVKVAEGFCRELLKASLTTAVTTAVVVVATRAAEKLMDRVETYSEPDPSPPVIVNVTVNQDGVTIDQGEYADED